MTPTEKDLATLTDREKAALLALIDKRNVYKKNGHGIAANIMGVAIWLVWQVWSHAPKISEEKV
jgi:predicted negative regulator of RcsB-dependent stress response